MKIKALKIFNDLEAKKLRKTGEIFDVSDQRAVELSAAHNCTLVEVVDKPKEKPPKKGR
jgi:hypothetical protein